MSGHALEIGDVVTEDGRKILTESMLEGEPTRAELIATLRQCRDVFARRYDGLGIEALCAADSLLARCGDGT